MAQILVRDLDPHVVERLKERAREGGRSLQAEARSILEQAAQLSPSEMRRLADDIRRGLPKRKRTSSTTLLREDRRR